MAEPALGAAPGLCGTCVHAHRTVTNRGTAYLRCLRAAADPAFPKYPPLPVVACRGYEAEKPR